MGKLTKQEMSTAYPKAKGWMIRRDWQGDMDIVLGVLLTKRSLSDIASERGVTREAVRLRFNRAMLCAWIRAGMPKLPEGMGGKITFKTVKGHEDFFRPFVKLLKEEASHG